jgi:hypothetical protein
MILAGRAGGIKGVMGAAAAGQADDLAYTEMLKRLQTGEEGNYLEDLATGSGIAASGPDDTAARRIMRGLTIPAAGGSAWLGGKLAGSAGLPLNIGADVLSGLGETALNIGGQGGKIDPSQLALSGGMAGLASLLGGRPRLPVSARSADVAPPPEIPVIPDAGPRPQYSQPAPSELFQVFPAEMTPPSRPLPGELPIESFAPPSAEFRPRQRREFDRGLAMEPPIVPSEAAAGEAALDSVLRQRELAEGVPESGESFSDAERKRLLRVPKGQYQKTVPTAAEAGLARIKESQAAEKGAMAAENQALIDQMTAAGLTPQEAKAALAKGRARIKAGPQEPAPSPAGAQPLPAQVTPPPVSDVGAPAGKIVPEASPERPQNVPKQEPISGVIQQENKGISPETASPKIAPLAETFVSGVKRGLKESEQPLPVAAPKEPAPKPGFTRFYHGGVDYQGGPRWLSPDKAYAEGYAAKSPGAKVFYVDVPEGHPGLKKSFDDEGTSMKAPYVSWEAPEDIARQMKPVAAPKAGEVAEAAPATQAPPAAKENPAPGLPEVEPGRALNKANLSKMRDVLDLGQYEKETQSLRETADKAISEGYAEPARVSALVQEVNTGKRTSISKEEHAGMVHRAVSLSDEQAKLYESLKTASPDAKREMLTAFDENQAHLRAIVTAADATGSEAGRRLNAQRLGFDREMDPAIIEARAEVKRGRPLTDKERARVQEASALFKKSDESFNKASDIERGNRAFDDLAKGPKRPKAELDAEIGRLRGEAHALLKQGCKILG